MSENGGDFKQSRVSYKMETVINKKTLILNMKNETNNKNTKNTFKKKKHWLKTSE
jgi:hypothetical protein